MEGGNKLDLKLRTMQFIKCSRLEAAGKKKPPM